MKNYIISILLFVLVNNKINGQAWQWAAGNGGINGDGGGSICVDQNGNSYAVGVLSAPEAYFQTDTLTVNGYSDFYLVKYDASGNEQWAKGFGGPYGNSNKTESGVVIYDSNTNSVYLAGSFISSCSLGSFNLSTSPNDQQIFIAKFDLNGNCIWAKSGGGGSDDFAGCIKVDPNGNIYLMGRVESSGSFDSYSVPKGGFLAKYDNSGNCLWAKNIISASNNPFGTSANPRAINYFNGDLFIYTSSDDDTIMIDTIQININSGNYGAIISRFDSSYTGNIRWAKLIGLPEASPVSALGIDNSGNLYLAGQYYNGTAIFDTDTIHSSGASDFFISKYDQNGNYIWVRNGNQGTGGQANYLLCNGDGNSYISGYFSGTADFGIYNVTATTSNDMYLARYDNSGNCLGVRHTGEAWGAGIASDANGNACITGFFVNSISFDLNSLTSHGQEDMFIAKIEAFTGIGGEDRIANNRLIIYANPTTGKCNVTIPDEFQHEKNLTLNIFDNSGKLIQQIPVQMNEGKIKLNLEAEAKGVYNVTLSNGKKSYNGKIVFE